MRAISPIVAAELADSVYEDGIEVIRIMSARRANKKERDLYEKCCFQRGL